MRPPLDSSYDIHRYQCILGLLCTPPKEIMYYNFDPASGPPTQRERERETETERGMEREGE